MKVLVTDASERSALAVIRSLGSKGIEVTAADSSSFNMGFGSKYCKHRVIYPSPRESKSNFLETILSFVKSETFDLLIPTTDFTLIPILEQLDEFEKYVRVAVPPNKIAMSAIDKGRTMRICKENGIPCPPTFIATNARELEEIASKISFPAVIKPRQKIFWRHDRAVVAKVTAKNYAVDPRDLVRKYSSLLEQSSSEFNSLLPFDFFIIQEYVHGRGYGVEMLRYGSEIDAVFVHRRLREYPVSGGASTLRESAWNDTLISYAKRMLDSIDWQGVAMVEFKYDETRKAGHLIEINGRFWGSLALAVNSGIDFPYLYFKEIMGEKVQKPAPYKIGVMQRWLLPGDLLWLYESINKGNSVVVSIKDFVRTSFARDDIISLKDPGPIVGAIKTIVESSADIIQGRANISGETIAQNMKQNKSKIENPIIAK